MNAELATLIDKSIMHSVLLTFQNIASAYVLHVPEIRVIISISKHAEQGRVTRTVCGHFKKRVAQMAIKGWTKWREIRTKGEDVILLLWLPHSKYILNAPRLDRDDVTIAARETLLF